MSGGLLSAPSIVCLCVKFPSRLPVYMLSGAPHVYLCIKFSYQLLVFFGYPSLLLLSKLVLLAAPSVCVTSASFNSLSMCTRKLLYGAAPRF